MFSRKAMKIKNVFAAFEICCCTEGWKSTEESTESRSGPVFAALDTVDHCWTSWYQPEYSFHVQPPALLVDGPDPPAFPVQHYPCPFHPCGPLRWHWASTRRTRLGLCHTHPSLRCTNLSPQHHPGRQVGWLQYQDPQANGKWELASLRYHHNNPLHSNSQQSQECICAVSPPAHYCIIPHAPPPPSLLDTSHTALPWYLDDMIIQDLKSWVLQNQYLDGDGWRTRPALSQRGRNKGGSFWGSHTVPLRAVSQWAALHCGVWLMC